MPKISIIVTAHNYGRYLKQAIDSVLGQTFPDFELIVVNDGSTDHTPEVLAAYEHEPRLKVLTLGGVGLARAANAGIRQSVGEYVIRLDADDYFDENILLVLNSVLDRHQEYGMVFPDYYRVNKYGAIIDQVRQPKVNDEVKLLDRSALAAGALYRRSCYDAVGGYNEELRYQEDYDFWIRFIDRFHVYNVQLPLMYYRQHAVSMSTNRDARMDARRYVKHKFVAEGRDLQGKRVVCVLPTVMENRYRHGLPLMDVAGRPLMSYAVERALGVEVFDRVIVDTEDARIAELARNLGAEVPFLRPRELARLDAAPVDHLRHLVRSLHEGEGYDPDIIVMVSYNHPFFKPAQLIEAVDTLLIYHCDSVISVTPNLRFHWKQGENGLEPVLHPRNQLTEQKQMILEERGGIIALNTANLRTDNFLGTRISYIESDEIEGLRVESDFTRWVAEQQLQATSAVSALEVAQ